MSQLGTERGASLQISKTWKLDCWGAIKVLQLKLLKYIIEDVTKGVQYQNTIDGVCVDCGTESEEKDDEN